MVLQKRLDYGFNGYQIPPTPRATRSPRRRVPFKKRHEENKMCAFDLLAVVAGKLLLDGESVPSSSDTSTENDQNRIVNDAVVKAVQDEEIPSKVESHDQESPASAFLVPELLPQVHEQHSSSQQCSHTENGLHLGLASGITTSDCSERLDAEKFVSGKSNKEIGTSASKEEVGSSRCREFADCDLEVENKSVTNDELPMPGAVVNGTVAEMCSTEDQIVRDEKCPAQISSEGNVKGLFHRNQNPCSSYPANRGDVNVVSRDDDENSSGCTHPINMRKTYRPAPRIGNRRIRKILASRYWKVAPRLKDLTVSNTDGDLKPAHFMKKNYYKHHRSERMYPFKKRRHFEWSSPSSSDGGINSEFITKSLQNGKSGDASGSYLNLHGATGESSSVTGQNASFQARDSHVKLRIKSFRVPELFIEIPESATVGSLKRTVMEAVTALLGGGLRIGVLLQGKKVRDDNKTLLQAGISHKSHSDALGFSLEPSSSQTHLLRPGDSHFLLPCEAPQPISSYPPTTTVVHQDSCAASPEPHALNMVNFIESDHDSAPSPTNTTIDKSITNSKALVPVPANVQALAVVQPPRKSKHSEMAQRRIRRPFSVAEVEALVQAVEKLGTGRWRDVKLRAFDDAKHRTYVDLKDKWKTLVHTARISPQQRRGEPVPQELLDRVLTAHAYWSQQQAKQQLKPSQPETCLLL